jgi:hypothetical protein
MIGGREMATIRDAPQLVGPFRDEDEARREVTRLNKARGGPGFFVERRDPVIGDKSPEGPYAYVPEESSPGCWHAALRLVPELR